jgi:glucosamine 6-phosphate synthetase-like amidotransferase/phosphosugar isomerase protein
MCGIIASAAGKNIVPGLVEGLKKLEYRGYDSAGQAVIGHSEIERVRSTGRVAELEAASAGTSAITGIVPTPAGRRTAFLPNAMPTHTFPAASPSSIWLIPCMD